MGRQYLESMSFGVSQDAAQTELLEEFIYNFTYDSPNNVNITDNHGNSVQLNISQGSQASMICNAEVFLFPSSIEVSATGHRCN